MISTSTLASPIAHIDIDDEPSDDTLANYRITDLSCEEEDVSTTRPSSTDTTDPPKDDPINCVQEDSTDLYAATDAVTSATQSGLNDKPPKLTATKLAPPKRYIPQPSVNRPQESLEPSLYDIPNLLGQFHNAKRAAWNEHYIREMHPFIGLTAPERHDVCRPIFKSTAKHPIDWDWLTFMWEENYRECQYIAIDYLKLHKGQLRPRDVPSLFNLASKKAWWDTIDGFLAIFGELQFRWPFELTPILLTWSEHSDPWIRRIAIAHQNNRYTTTDTQLLECIIRNNMSETDPFITKAIGWALRCYARTDPIWVKEFVDAYEDELPLLSKREALKLIGGYSPKENSDL